MEFKKLLVRRHAKNIAVRIIANGIIVLPKAVYIFGKIRDIDNIMSENIWHDQQLEKNLYASAIFTGENERYIEKPAITPAPAIPPITNGDAAPAVNGRNDKNIIQNFFNRFIVFKYIIFCPKCDIIEKINIKVENVL